MHVCHIKGEYICRIKFYHIRKNPIGSRKLIALGFLRIELISPVVSAFHKNALVLGDCIWNDFFKLHVMTVMDFYMI